MVEFRSPVIDDEFKRRRAYKSVYADAADKPGQWAVIATYEGASDTADDLRRRKSADVRASDIRLGKIKEAAQYGEWESVVQKNQESGRWELFVRLVRVI
jgi:hypothetical protein